MEEIKKENNCGKMEVRVETSETKRAKIAERLGFDQPSALDLVDRRDYQSEDAYLDAAVKAEMERNSPEYQAIRRKLAAEYRQKQEAARAAAQAFEDVAERDEQTRLHNAIETAITALSDEEAYAVRAEHYCGGEVDRKAYSKAIRHLRHPAISRQLKPYLKA